MTAEEAVDLPLEEEPDPQPDPPLEEEPAPQPDELKLIPLFARELKRFVGYAIVCSLMGLVVAEGVLRLFGLPTGAQRSMRSVYDVEGETLGVFQANTSMYMAWPPEFPYHCTFNSLGCRGAEPRESDQPPLLCIGDSLTFGWGVQDDESWPALLDARLAEAGRPRAVVNLSSGHLVLEDELGYLPRAMQELKPSHVILLAPGQGYIDSVLNLRVTPHQRSKRRETERRAANALRTIYRKTALYEAQYFSKIYRKRLSLIGRGILPAINEFKKEELAKLRARYRANLLVFRDRVEAGGAVFVLAIFPEMELTEEGVRYVDPWVARVAKELGIPCLDVTPSFAADPDGNSLVQLPYDLHATKRGNAHIAEAVFEELSR